MPNEKMPSLLSIESLFPNARYSYDLETLIGREVKYNKHGLPITKEKVVYTKEQIEQNKFYIGSNTIFQKSGGWGHPNVEDAVRHAQQMLQMDESKTEVFIVEIVRVVRRKPIEVDVETI
jgi:hypothetical protein